MILTSGFYIFVLLNKNKAYKCLKMTLFKSLICYDKVGKKINMAAKDEDACDREYMSFRSSTQLGKFGLSRNPVTCNPSMNLTVLQCSLHCIWSRPYAGYISQEVSFGTKILAL
jgi:hypothetical protein